MKLVDLFPDDKKQETDANAVEEDRDGSDDEQILNSSDNESHTAEIDEDSEDDCMTFYTYLDSWIGASNKSM